MHMRSFVQYCSAVAHDCVFQKAIEGTVEQCMTAQQARFTELTQRQMDVPALINKNRQRDVNVQQRQAAQEVRLEALRTLLNLQQTTAIRHWGPPCLEDREGDKEKLAQALEELTTDSQAVTALYSQNGQCRLNHRHHAEELSKLHSDLEHRMQEAQGHWDSYPHDNHRDGEDVEFLAKLQQDLTEVAALASRATSTISTSQSQLEQEGEELDKEKQVLLDLQAALNVHEHDLTTEKQRLHNEDRLHEQDDAARSGKELAIARVSTARANQLKEYSSQLTAHQRALASSVASLPREGSNVTDRSLLIELEKGLARRMGQMEQLDVQVESHHFGLGLVGDDFDMSVMCTDPLGL